MNERLGASSRSSSSHQPALAHRRDDVRLRWIVSGAHDLSGFLARKLSAFGRLWEEIDDADGMVARDADEKVRGGVWELDGEAPDAGGGCGAAGCVHARSGATSDRYHEDGLDGLVDSG